METIKEDGKWIERHDIPKEMEGFEKSNAHFIYALNEFRSEKRYESKLEEEYFHGE